MVISQPWIDAANENDPHPTEAEIVAFMESLGFSRLEDSFYGWYNSEKGIRVVDARPDNFINSSQGVVPIDLIISEETSP